MKRKLHFLLVILVISALLTGCAGNSNDSALSSTGANGDSTKKITELTFASAEWAGTDAYQLNGVDVLYCLIGDTILSLQPEGTITPNVAKDFSVSEDGKTIVLTIPGDFKYADGTTLKPEDVKRSIEWGLEVSPYNSDFAAISKIEIEGNNVTLHLDEYSSSVLYSLATELYVMSAEQINTLSKEELMWKALPYGPFSVDKYVEGSNITLKRNPYYKTNNPNVKNKGPMNVEKATVKFMTDEFALASSITAGEVDFTTAYPSSLLSQLSKNADMEYKWIKNYGIIRIFLNNDDKVLKDLAVREAIMLLVNREELANFSEGQLSPAYAFSMEGMIDYSKEAADYFRENYSNDPEKAKKLLSNAGWSDSDKDGYLDKNGKPLSFTLNIIDNSISKTIAEFLQIKLKDAGIKMEIQLLDLPGQRKQVMEDTYSASLHSFSWGDTASTLPYIVSDRNILPDDSYFSICTAASANPNSQERIKSLVQAQKILMDTKSVMPIVTINGLVVYNSQKLRDAIVLDYGYIYFNDVK